LDSLFCLVNFVFDSLLPIPVALLLPVAPTEQRPATFRATESELDQEPGDEVHWNSDWFSTGFGTNAGGSVMGLAGLKRYSLYDFPSTLRSSI
jgi:hypothetical protein